MQSARDDGGEAARGSERPRRSTHRRRRRLALLLGVAAIAAALTVGVLVFGEREQPTRAGSARITLLDARRRRPLARVEGAALLTPPGRVALLGGGRRPAFVDVWASWCNGCRQAAPGLVRLWRRFGPRIRFVDVDSQDPRRPAVAFVRRYGLGFPQLFNRRRPPQHASASWYPDCLPCRPAWTRSGKDRRAAGRGRVRAGA